MFSRGKKSRPLKSSWNALYHCYVTGIGFLQKKKKMSLCTLPMRDNVYKLISWQTDSRHVSWQQSLIPMHPYPIFFHLSFTSLLFLILHTTKSFGLDNDVKLKSQTCPLPPEAPWESGLLSSSLPRQHGGYLGVACLQARASTGYLKQGLSVTDIPPPSPPSSAPGHSSQ